MAMQITTSTFPELDAKICVGVLFNQKIMNNEYVIVDSNLISQISRHHPMCIILKFFEEESFVLFLLLRQSYSCQNENDDDGG